jgi:bile acid-coenzyme A ligase
MTHMALLHGASVVRMERLDAREFLDLVEQFRVQWVALVPTMMNRVARLANELRESRDVSSLEHIWHTAAPMPFWLKPFWIDWLGPERIWEMHGGSEGIGITQLDGSEWLKHRSSVGRPLGGELLIRGEDDEPLPPGEVGEVYMWRIGAGPGKAHLSIAMLEHNRSACQMGSNRRATSAGSTPIWARECMQSFGSKPGRMQLPGSYWPLPASG